MLTQKSKEHCKVCNHRLTKNGHCLSCARRGNNNRARGKKKAAPKTGAEPKATPKEFRDMTASEVCKEAGIQSCHNCDDMSCGDNLSRIEPAAATIHASQPPKSEPVIKIEEADVCRRAVLQYGMSRQICKAAEECAELAAAISRHFATEGSTAEVISEIADVEIMCVQLRMIFGADKIDTARAEKVARLHGRLKTEF